MRTRLFRVQECPIIYLIVTMMSTLLTRDAPMNFNKAGIVKPIVVLPRTFHSLGNVSIVGLLEAIGYFDCMIRFRKKIFAQHSCGVLKVLKNGCSTRKTNAPRAAGMLPK